MHLDRQYSSGKSHSGVGHDEEHRCQNAANYHEKYEITKKELCEDVDKVICISSFSDVHEIEKNVEEKILMRNLQQEESTHLDIGHSNNEICEVDSDHIAAKCCIDSTQKTTQRRPTLRELLQLPEDCGSPSGVLPQSKIFMRSEHQGFKLDERLKDFFEPIILSLSVHTETYALYAEQKQLVKQKAVSKQYKWWRIFKIKGLSWSSLYKPGYIKPDDIESKKSQRKNKNGIFGKVTKSAERRKLLKASDHIG